MQVSWTFPQLLGIVMIVCVSMVAGVSRVRPMSESAVLILGAHYLVINTLCWNAFMITSAFEEGTVIFRYGLSPLLPAASFYVGVLITVMNFVSLISVLRRTRLYSCRQRWAFSVGSTALIFGTVVSLRTPVALQRLIDSSWG